MQTFKNILFLLSNKERKSALILLFMIFVMALLDTIGVASILPFIAIITNPTLIETNLFLKTMFETSKIFGVKSNQEFIFALGVLVFVLLVISLIFKAVTIYFQSRFVQMMEYSIGKRLVETYLNQPYSWFLNHHSTDLGKTILSEVNAVVGGAFSPFFEIITKGMIAIALIILLIIADPRLALLVGFLLIGSYAIIYNYIRNYLNRMGKERFRNNQLRFIAVSEGFGAAKEVKVGGLEKNYIKRFAEPAKNLALNQAYSSIIAQLPRFALEAIAFGGILLIILYMISQSGSFNSVLPIISLYVYAGYRLMPALQQVYASFTQLNFATPSLDNLYNDFKNLELSELNQDQGVLPFNESIKLKNIYYNYPNASQITLEDINITIPAKTTIGLVGPSGSGKTTIVDLILGLLETKRGTLEIDGKIINRKNVRSWQRSIGYVPQHLYLSDDTIMGNIAFGVDPKNINQGAVIKASKIANLHDFITNELPEKYLTKVGERGVRLSGGQLQRIGIARALYNDPKVLILDEATSSLDYETEKVLINAINKLGKHITIIIIAHRLNTVKRCDKILVLEKGKIKDQGTFEKLFKTNENFFKNVSNK
jgi:ABC-type multidrug transport system fused ATPase/permease subunit